MAAMNVGGSGDAAQQRPRRRLGEGPNVRAFRDPNESKQGVDGTPVNIVSNYFKVTRLPNFVGLFQYVVSITPDVGNTRFRHALLHKCNHIIGNTKCFDGMTLFLPLKLEEQHTSIPVKSEKGEDFVVKISFTNRVPENSPAVVQLMNILFKRLVSFLGIVY